MNFCSIFQPFPGKESRPDRVFVSDDLAVTSAELHGYGTTYRRKFMYHVLWQRLERVLSATYDSWQGQRGRSCAHDCGPHASCRCGVCVGGHEDKNVCHLPDCEECSPLTFSLLLLSLTVTVILLVQLIFGALQVLLTMNERSKSLDQSTDRQTGLMGNCCLCDPQLYRDMSVRLRRYKKSLLCRVWPLCRLPPMLLVIVSLLMIFVYVEFTLMMFKDAVDDVYAVIPEELYPSDHLMLTVKLVKSKS